MALKAMAALCIPEWTVVHFIVFVLRYCLVGMLIVFFFFAFVPPHFIIHVFAIDCNLEASKTLELHCWQKNSHNILVEWTELKLVLLATQ